MEEAERTAEDARLHRVRRNKLRRQALKQGLVLRQTEHGYALLDIRKSHVEADGRLVHLNLDDVEAYLSKP